ncbi:ankyrin repeat domain-containing protein [Gemmata sp.]|uniref:ankyrin repeat domain-containing protein n=1 Tax=Gemmata sp. TaxID=1914242 RepID=UPI003F718F51
MMALLAGSLAMALVAVDPPGDVSADEVARFHFLLGRGEREPGELEKAKRCLAAKPALARTRSDVFARTPLHSAAECGDAELARYLLRRGARTGASDIHGRTPLHFASTPSVARFLIANGADIDARDQHGRTPLADAVDQCGRYILPDAARHLGVARVLVAAGATCDPLTAAFIGDTNRLRAALLAAPALARNDKLVVAAVSGGHAPTVQLLLDSAANPNAVDEDRSPNPALFYALAHPDVVRVLLTAGAKSKGRFKPIRYSKGFMTDNGQTLLHYAADKGHVETAKLLLEAGADMNSRDALLGETPLQCAAMFGRVEMIRFLLDQKASVRGTTGMVAMSRAGGDNRAAVIRILRNAGVPLDLFSALEIGDEAYARMLIEAVPLLAFATHQHFSVLEMAAFKGHNDLVALLLDMGVPIEAGDNSALMAGVWGRHPSTIELLLRRGANVNWQRHSGYALLHSAETAAVANQLIGAGADVNARSGDGRTPLHDAVESGKHAVAEALLDAKADVNAADKNGRTPLHVAVERENVEAVRLLLTAGADANAADKDEKTPLGYTNTYSDPDIVALLKSRGAK